MRQTLAVIGVMLLLPAGMHAQIVRGVVHIDGSGSPIPAAVLELVDPDGELSDSTVTDSVGRFSMSARREGRYLIRVSHLAFASMARPLELTRGYEINVELRMAPNAIALEPLIVTSRREVPLQYVGFYRRSRSGFGRFLTREDIERRQPIRTTDLFYVMPRVHLTQVGSMGNAGSQMITMRAGAGQQCEPAIFVDGMQSLTAQDVNMLMPDDIDGIEIYASPALTPAEFQRNTNCGAILFWLRKDGGDRPFTWKRLFIGVGAFLGLVLISGA